MLGRRIELSSSKFILCILVLILGVTTLTASAIPYGSGTYGSCQYGSCSISVTSNSSVSLNVTPTTSGKCTIQNDVVQVLTDDSSGYTLSLVNSSSTSTALSNGSNTIPATSGTFSSPSALTANTWGYRVDGWGNFTGGTTTAQNNISPPATVFAGTPANTGSPGPDTIASTATAADPAVSTKVWYGVCASTSTTKGLYTAQITYSAVTN